MAFCDLTFRLRRSFVVGYALVALAFSATLLVESRRRGLAEVAFWLSAYVGVAVLSALRPKVGPLVAGLTAFLLGFARTYRHGVNLDLGLGLITLALGVYLLRGALRARDEYRVDLAGLSLLAIASWSVVSLAFALARIRGFAPAPGFAYHAYRFNPLGLSSEEALVRAITGAAATFAWFGLYEWGRRLDLSLPPKVGSPPRVDRPFGRGWPFGGGQLLLGGGVFVALLVNSAVLLYQSYGDPGFLHPVGSRIQRLNGVTSFCYALGDASVALFLLLPAWAASRGPRAVLTVGSLVLLAHAVLASGSRTALLTVLATALLWTLLHATRLAARRRALAVFMCTGVVAFALLGAWAAYRSTPPDKTTPLGRLRGGIERHGVLGHLFVTRLSSYPLILRILREYPLAGIGVGLYQPEIAKQHALLTPDLPILDPLLMVSYGPNQFLNTGVELGLPALLALALVFSCALASALTHRERHRSLELAVSVIALAGALQLGPAFYNSEALVFCWLVVARAAAPAAADEATGAPPRNGGGPGTRATTVLLAACLVLGLAGQLLARPSLAVDTQWKRLRWRLNIGMQPLQPNGQWTGAEATFSVKTDARAVSLRWHAGDPAAPGYRAAVAFYVDGALVASTPALPGRIRETVLALPAGPGFKRISVRVSPPFVPAEFLGGDDRRQLGLFLHAVTPVDAGERSGARP